ncbi:hypothetical protein TthWC1_2359 [Thermoanaerobacter thermohydrosulfuricus WC1]|uniref:Phage protein Gp138 N-terminal domain-containing protein n=1 Tax=Thermoanaerobacter thermohydrosulfuricus WC1 TaxID=1198630 RepID=M8CUS9_THETY|nr:hypothetical protein [Thermoanaerobacter thermohydrosulfuricus]EMT38118.1 hypothetical protein TthWC1_2359 [Thermoanaerobacter thermohydrosulfuricus WC1]
MANGISKLAQVIAERIASQTQRPDMLELGTIQADMSLKLDRFAVPIPQGDYLICRSLTLPDPMAVTSATSVGDHGSHSHNVLRPSQLAPLAPGDRVLVAWVNDGMDLVVIDVVVNS